MAFIRKRGKKFSVIYRIKDDNGKERQTSETFSTQKDAERRQKEIEYKMAIGKFEVPKCTILEELRKEHQESGVVSDLLFPSPRSNTRAISDMGLLYALRGMGYERDEMCIHGFRSIASTLLNESGKYRAEAIEAALAHAERNQVRAAYNRAEYLEERRILMQDWADRVDAMRAGKS